MTLSEQHQIDNIVLALNMIDRSLTAILFMGFFILLAICLNAFRK